MSRRHYEEYFLTGRGGGKEVEMDIESYIDEEERERNGTVVGCATPSIH